MVCNSPDKTLEDVVNIGFVFVDWGTAFNLQQARLFAEPVAPILHTAQSHIALEFILSYKGAAYLPRALVTSYLESGQLFPVQEMEEIGQDVYLVCSKNSEKANDLAPIISFFEELDTSVQLIEQ